MGEMSPPPALDARVRLLIALGVSVAIAIVDRLDVLMLALLAVCLLMLASPPAIALRDLLRRLAPLALFLLVLALLLPPAHAARIALKAGCIVLLVSTLLSAMSVVTLGHALEHLRVPPRFALLMMLSVRYVDVIRLEADRLQRAMRARGFSPRINAHTYRTLGYLVGMLLVRSFERGQRVLDAMKCRGFQHAHPHSRPHPHSRYQNQIRTSRIASGGHVHIRPLTCTDWAALSAAGLAAACLLWGAA